MIKMKSEIYPPKEDSYFLTQILEEQILKFLNQKSNPIILEIGSGSGIQLETSLKSGIKKQNIYSCDINPLSVKHCKNLGFNCIYSDLFETIKGKFDLIIFNPPYLPEDSLESESSRISTTGGETGNEIINEFLKQAIHYLNKNGKIFLLVSSFSGEIDFLDYKKKILAKRKLFFEELIIWELRV